jgi:opacity protein-like surface antigen
MKKLLLSAFLLSSTLGVFAQTTAKKSSLAIGLGPSFAVGDFSSKTASDESAGLAITGFFIDLGYQYQFSKNVGSITLFKGKIHAIDKNAFGYTVPTGSGGSVKFDATSWKIGSILSGLTQTFPLSSGGTFSVEFRELAGVQFTSSPELNINYNIPGLGSYSGTQESQSAKSFAYLVGLGFKYQISNGLGLKLFGDYNNSNVTFKQFTITSGATTTTLPESKQNTGTINAGVGLVIEL